MAEQVVVERARRAGSHRSRQCRPQDLSGVAQVSKHLGHPLVIRPQPTQTILRNGRIRIGGNCLRLLRPHGIEKLQR